MPVDLSQFFVVGISSRALFDLEQEEQIFRAHGLQAFREHQLQHENEVLPMGSAFHLIQGLLGMNQFLQARKIEVILLSHNHPDASLRVLHSIDHYKLGITRAALTGGAALGAYLEAFKVKLLLTPDKEDLKMAVAQGIAASLIYSPPPEIVRAPAQIRIAFDADCVIFSDEAQRVCDEKGLVAFHAHEKANARNALPPGPFAELLKLLSEAQVEPPVPSPIRIGLFTDRNGPAHERALRTLRGWDVRIDEALFLGGAPKVDFLRAFGAHIFFDDREDYCKLAAPAVPTAQVLMPFSPGAEATMRIEERRDATGKQRFLLVCNGFLKGEYAEAETELTEWFDVNVRDWPDPKLAAFTEEFESSVVNTPPSGRQRPTVGAEANKKAELNIFLNKLARKHRSR